MKIVKDSNEMYHSHESISASGLKTIARSSVKHFLEQEFKETDAMKFGTAVHQAILEPHDFYDIYYALPNFGDLRKKENKELKKQEELKAEGKICLSHNEHEAIKKILENYNKNELAKHYCKGEIELSHYLKHDGIDVRVRPDVINRVSGFIADVKTTKNNNPDKFRWTVRDFGYHIQAAFYMDMLGVDTFKIIAVENVKPYTVNVQTIDKESIEKGRKLYKKALDDWKLYVRENKIKSYSWSSMADDGSYLIKI
jgi:predicted transcriptional regulator